MPEVDDDDPVDALVREGDGPGVRLDDLDLAVHPRDLLAEDLQHGGIGVQGDVPIPPGDEGKGDAPRAHPELQEHGLLPFGCTAEAMAVAIWPATSGGWALSLS